MMIAFFMDGLQNGKFLMIVIFKRVHIGHPFIGKMTVAAVEQKKVKRIVFVKFGIIPVIFKGILVGISFLDNILPVFQIIMNILRPAYRTLNLPFDIRYRFFFI
jgi:hypothetical protein